MAKRSGADHHPAPKLTENPDFIGCVCGKTRFLFTGVGDANTRPTPTSLHAAPGLINLLNTLILR